MPYFPLTPSEETVMLEEIGVKGFDDLLTHIPKKLRYPEIRIPMSPGEMALKKEMVSFSEKNRNTQNTSSFLGAGLYEHFVPSAVDHLLRRGEFLTAYTPYQAEASQGTLQVIYEFQTMICRLTGMDVSNASHYDGSTALAEAALLSLHHRSRKQILVSSLLHPHYKQVVKTYLQGTPSELIEIPYTKDGSLDREFIKKHLSTETAAVIVSSPNFFGVVENYEDIAALAHAQEALLIVSANPLSLSFYSSPREWGADIVTGEGQPLGIRLNLGGPVLGFFAVTKELMRRIPGRIAGQTKDTDGQRAFVLTLQAREQHIRREKAASNICTNQALLALSATLYLSLMGEKGLRRVGEMNVANASYLKEAISKLDKFSLRFDGTPFNEFVVRYEGNVHQLLEKLLGKNIIGGLALDVFYPELKNEFLVCATETKSREDLDQFVQVLEEASR